MITWPCAGPAPSLTFLTHAVIIALVVEASVVRLTLVLSQVTAGTCNNRTTRSRGGTNGRQNQNYSFLFLVAGLKPIQGTWSLTWEAVQMVVTWFDCVRVHRHVSAAQVLTPLLVCDSKQQWLDSQTVGPALNSQQLHTSIFPPCSFTDVHGCRSFHICNVILCCPFTTGSHMTL